MPRIEFTRYEQIWQTRKIVWTDVMNILKFTRTNTVEFLLKKP